MEAKALLAEQNETFAFVLEASNDSVEAMAVFRQFTKALSIRPHVLMVLIPKPPRREEAKAVR